MGFAIDDARHADMLITITGSEFPEDKESGYRQLEAEGIPRQRVDTAIERAKKRKGVRELILIKEWICAIFPDWNQ